MDADSLAQLDKTALIALVLTQAEQIAALQARVAALEAKLAVPPKTPDNSSLPPSKGHKPNRPDRKGKRSPRAGPVSRAICAPPRTTCATSTRKPAPAAAPTWARPTSPTCTPTTTSIPACAGTSRPPIQPITTRVNLHSGACPCCHARVAAEAPADMPIGSPFGPGIAALVIYLHACQMVSYNRLVEMLKGLFGLTISQGAIANMLNRAAAPFAAAGRSIEAHVRSAAVIASDETSARVKGKTHWQWVFGCATAVFHIIAPSRAKAVVTTFLAGAKPQVWLSDRLAAQCGHAEAHQFCLAHLLRDAQYAIDAGDDVFAPGFKGLLKRACAIGRRRGELADTTLLSYRRDLDRRLDRLLAVRPTTVAGIKLKAAIAGCREKLFVFVTRRDVAPTNNVSERALRPSVIFRKVTNGFRSTWGASSYADICSVIATGRLDGHTALAAIRNCLAGRPVLKPV